MAGIYTIVAQILTAIIAGMGGYYGILTYFFLKDHGFDRHVATTMFLSVEKSVLLLTFGVIFFAVNQITMAASIATTAKIETFNILLDLLAALFFAFAIRNLWKTLTLQIDEDA